MNYLEIYNKLCGKGKEDRNLEYSELHHIIPECINGTNDVDNLTRLTAREHYVAHWLLYKIYPKVWKISHAFFWMAMENKKNGRRITSRQFERAKIAMASNCADRMRDEGNPMHKQSAKDKISKRMKDSNPVRTHPTTHNSYLLKNRLMIGPSKDGKWFNDGKKSKYFKPNDVVPTGWLPGMASYADRGKWITNGVKNKKLKIGQEMPEGFKYGKRKRIIE